MYFRYGTSSRFAQIIESCTERFSTEFELNEVKFYFLTTTQIHVQNNCVGLLAFVHLPTLGPQRVL